MLNYTLFPEYS